MGLPVSLILIAVGAILAFAVNQDSGSAVDVDAVGWILMAVGFVGLLLSLFWWERFGPGAWGLHRPGYTYDDAPRARGYGRRRTVVEDEGPAPAAGPPAPPPDGPPPP